MKVWRLLQPMFWIKIRIILHIFALLCEILEMEFSSTDRCHFDLSRDAQDYSVYDVHRVYSSVKSDLQSLHSSSPVDTVSQLDVFNSAYSDAQGECKQSLCETISGPTNYYTADFMRNIKCKMEPSITSLDCIERLKALGILRRFHRGCRGGRRRGRRRDYKQTSGYSEDSNVTKELDVHPIPVIISNRSNPILKNLSSADRTYLESRRRNNNISCVTLTEKSLTSNRCRDQIGHRILFVNATSLAKPDALSHLQVDLLSYDVEIGLVAETWMKKSKHLDSMFSIDGYCLLRQDRPNRKGGGVLAYVKNDLLAERLSFLRSCSNAKYEVLWFKCKHPKLAFMFYYCVIYHPPKPIYDSKELIDDLMNDIDDLAIADPDAIISIIGDLNDLDHSKLETESGLVQLVKDVTHGRKNSR